MKREVYLMAGPRDRKVTLPLDSRYEISVRPAYRPSEEPPSPLEIFLEHSFNRLGWVVGAVTFVLLATLVVAQTYIHFHRLHF